MPIFVGICIYFLSRKNFFRTGSIHNKVNNSVTDKNKTTNKKIAIKKVEKENLFEEQ